MSKYIPAAIKYTPTTAKQINYHGTPKVGPQEHLTWNHEEPPKFYVPRYQFTLMPYTDPHGPNLSLHPVTHQYCIHNKYWGNKLTRTTNICVADWYTQTYEGGKLLPTTQGLPWEKPHTCALHDWRVVVAPSGKTGTFFHLSRVS